MILDKFRAWLKSLSEVEKSQVVCPTGLSRRRFLKALGVATVSVSTGGLLVAEKPLTVEEAIKNLSLTTLHWETRGGMQINFKVMTVMLGKPRDTFVLSTEP